MEVKESFPHRTVVKYTIEAYCNMFPELTFDYFGIEKSEICLVTRKGSFYMPPPSTNDDLLLAELKPSANFCHNPVKVLFSLEKLQASLLVFERTIETIGPILSLDEKSKEFVASQTIYEILEKLSVQGKYHICGGFTAEECDLTETEINSGSAFLKKIRIVKYPFLFITSVGCTGIFKENGGSGGSQTLNKCESCRHWNYLFPDCRQNVHFKKEDAEIADKVYLPNNETLNEMVIKLEPADIETQASFDSNSTTSVSSKSEPFDEGVKFEHTFSTDSNEPTNTFIDENFESHQAIHFERLKLKGTDLVCKICGKLTSSGYDLRRHMRTHTGERPFSCHICPKSFSANSSLKTHIATHSDERPFVCEMCDLSFKRRDKLNLHVRTHTGEKPFSCKICDKRFNLNEQLKKHSVIHSEERNYSCVTCDKKFKTNSHLKSHMRVH